MRSATLLLLVFFALLSFIKGEKDVIQTSVRSSKKTFQCTFKMIVDGKVVDIEKSKLSCSPSKPKGRKRQNLKIDGKLGSYIVSITINPSKIKTAEFTPNPLPEADDCNLGYTRVCLPDSMNNCEEGMYKYCPNETDGQTLSERGQDCNCLPAFTVSQAVSSGVSPLGCGKACVCLSEEFMQCDNRTEPGRCFCGLINKPGSTRIFGGRPSLKNRYPWMARFSYKERNHACGGSLISSRWILTAAHCVESCDDDGNNCVDRQSSDIKVFLGDHNKDILEGQEKKMDISKIFVHPDYERRVLVHDVALLKLIKEVDFTNDAHRHIRPICLPSDHTQSYEGWEATVAGWGLRGGGLEGGEENSPSILQEINATVLANSDPKCRRDNSKLCVTHPDGQKMCKGDSGGPLISKPADHDGATPGQNYELIGVNSFVNTHFCGEDGDYFGGYARVTEHLTWIEETMGTAEHTTCPRE